MSSSYHGENTRKRPRTEIHVLGAEPPDATTHDQKHWYSDGSIVLRIESTLFRVHKTILAVSSEVFKDMLSVPQPEGQEDLQGCIVVGLHGDSVESWRHLLDALYDAPYFASMHSAPLHPALPILSGILRLATKYRFLGYRRECLGILGRHFPTYYDDIPILIADASDAAAVINLARETDAHCLLPFAFLACVYPVDDRNRPLIYGDLLPSFRDKAAALQGLHALAAAQKLHMFPFAYDTPDITITSCRRRCTTEVAFKDITKYSEQPMYFDFEDPGRWTEPEGRDLLCRDCLEYVKRVYSQGRRQVWKHLPEFFCVGKDWDELIRLQNYGN
ncbi:hypothetical protein BD626DRAFT_459042 [Schizophyllum amplum]|uniref:BTB domain-containing protein n=1 Tax=Schizophyllum amplum TaxID=97359 RepID=A0A550CB74_9AGAR|nr:hypothetical protein BD626DRAFT_459042 [Auriculariopsis ampla]